ncbi:MAG TPA: tRNA-dihydrouridine synthase [Candidatus Saccharimonadales bacterium]|nr:tRNA-dihydrouridine synthase [Candidatus Saccharimonadales bacterium]
MKNFWKDLPKPFFCLAPLDDVSDTVFREVVIRACLSGRQAGAPNAVFTEFANTDGYLHPKGRISVQRKLDVNDSERELGVPLIAQIWGANPDHYYQTAKELASTGMYAGIDINMGCPEKGIVKRGCCGGLIKEENWDNAAAIIQAVKKGGDDLPVSVKTRIGVNKIITEDWISHILKQDIALLTVHGRTVKEMSKVPAHWEEIGKAVKLRDQIAPHTLIVGNGDVESREQGEELAAKYGLDGIMIGRGVFHNLFVFNKEQTDHTPEEMLKILLNHVDLYGRTWGSDKSYQPLKKFFKIYVSGFPNAAELRAQLMGTKTPDEAREIVNSYLKQPITA